MRYVVDTTSDNVSTRQVDSCVKLHGRHPKTDLRLLRRLSARRAQRELMTIRGYVAFSEFGGGLVRRALGEERTR